ncbi:beta-lactamase/transpeptidase-like protein [Clavulina sp. PMI_390]|nr:beta-lactamase/transpeptidase-like protein [Clavulina sp. PMI_390]
MDPGRGRNTLAVDHTLHRNVQELFDHAVASKIAPGFQFVLFDQDSFLINGVSGLNLSSQATDSQVARSSNPSHETKMAKNDVHWIASAGKLVVALVSLIILERNLAHNGMSFADLDDHEKLVEIVPEFKRGSGSLVTQIIDGWEDGLDEQGRRRPRLREAETLITLRMLFTHSAGFNFPWAHPLIAEWFIPSDGSVPLKQPRISGLIDSFTLPLVHEPGTKVSYGFSTDWLAQWAVRSTGKSLRQLIATYILEPLCIPLTECDTVLTPEIEPHLTTTYHRRDNEEIPLVRGPRPPFYNCTGVPPPGYAHYASAPLVSSTQAYCLILQAVLTHDSRLLINEDTWALAEKDALEGQGISVPVPRVQSYEPKLATDLMYFSKPVDSTKTSSMNLLNAEVALGPTTSGRPAGSYGWAGSWNTYFLIDPVKKFGYMWSAQCGPWVHPQFLALKDQFEMLIYESIETRKAI